MPEIEKNSDREYSRWSAVYAGQEYFYGDEPGPLARRAVRYHRPLWHKGRTPSALDVGCGEGQDAAFLSSRGYNVTGVDFVENALTKAQRLLELQNLQAQLEHVDLLHWNPQGQYDLVLACNSLQFLGENVPLIIERVIEATAPGGVLGLSLFACQEGEEVRDGIYFTSLETLLARFDYAGDNQSWQMFETTRLWQWNTTANAPQPFVTLIGHRLK